MNKTPHSLQLPEIANLRKSQAFSFTLGFAGFVFLPLAGRISIAEVLAVVALLGILFARRALVHPAIAWFLFSFVILLVGLLMATIAHDDSFLSAIFASANYGFVIVMAGILSMQLRLTNGSSWRYLVIGAASGQVLGYLLNPTRSALIDPWKFGFGWTVTLCVLLLVQVIEGMPKLRGGALPLIVLLSGIHFALNSRSLAIIVLICGVLVLYQRNLIGTTRKPNKGAGKMLVLIGLAIYAATLIYETLASSGYFGLLVQSKFFDQQGDYGLLFGARKELVVLAIAWLRSPIFGWGPSAHVPPEVLNAAQEWFIAGRYFMSFSDTHRLFGVESLPLHSIILGGLIQAGIFFIPMGLCMLWIVIRALKNVTSSGDFVGLFIVLAALVHLFMSPLGDTTRLPVAMALSLGFYRLGQLPEKNLVAAQDEFAQYGRGR